MSKYGNILVHRIALFIQQGVVMETCQLWCIRCHLTVTDSPAVMCVYPVKGDFPT